MSEPELAAARAAGRTEASRSLEMRLKGAIVGMLDLPFRIRYRGAVRAARSARVRYRGMRLLPGCSVEIGERTMLEGKVLFDRAGASVRIGDRTFVGRSTIVAASSVTIGSDVMIAWGCTIVDHDSHSVRFSIRRNDPGDWYEGRKDWTHVAIAPVVIADGAWIGLNAIVLKGVTVGEGAVVAAGSVVTKDVEPWTVVAGNPARVVKTLGPDER